MIPMVPVGSSGKGDLWVELAVFTVIFLLIPGTLSIVFVYEALFNLETHMVPTLSLPITYILVMFLRWTLAQYRRFSCTSS